MKPAEFQIIKERFEREQTRWEGLKVGDIIYEQIPREFEFDYHKMEIDSINVDERELKAHDVACDHNTTLTFFLTEEEFENRKY